MALNKITLEGKLGKDPETKNLSTGKKIVKFSLATPRNYKDAKGDYITDWHNCIAFGELANDIDGILSKGQSVKVEGKSYNNNYKDANGVMKYSFQVALDKVTIDGVDYGFTPKKKDDEEAEPESKQQPEPEKKKPGRKPKDESDYASDVPF
jgi:single-strand DNA-binding protein